MTSDEINRTIEFILKHQANAAALMEETDVQIKETGRQIRELTASTNRFQEEMKGFIKILVPLLEIQSRRLDRLEGLS